MDNKKNIILVGMPGAGKTYIGEKLSEKLKDFKFIDTDALIEKRLEMSVVEIFENRGEIAFRKEEDAVINELINSEDKQIIALGGGAFRDKNIKLLKKNGVIFYLKAPINLLYERIKNEATRPMFLNSDNVKIKLAKILEEREPNFLKANFVIEQDKYTTEELLNYIVKEYEILKDCIDILPSPVFITNGDFNSFEEKISQYVSGKGLILIDEKIEKLYGKRIQLKNYPRYVLKEGEAQKNIKNYEKIIDFAIQNKIERGDTLIAIGGGVTGDIGGFVASTYLRGINLLHVPTTLLACVDSSIGGKNGINTSRGKNLIGTFYQPKAIFCNLNFLLTLDDKQFKTGMAEVLKYAFIEYSCNSETEYNLLEFLEKNVEQIKSRDEKTIEEIVRICVELKSYVVFKDEKEKGLRQILNFGHTYGHALEKISNYKLTHGEAVARGIIFAFELALKNRLISRKYFERSMNLLKSYDLYTPIKGVNKKVVEVMELDKKIKNGKINFVLPFCPKTVEIMKINPQSFIHS